MWSLYGMHGRLEGSLSLSLSLSPSLSVTHRAVLFRKSIVMLLPAMRMTTDTKTQQQQMRVAVRLPVLSHGHRRSLPTNYHITAVVTLIVIVVSAAFL